MENNVTIDSWDGIIKNFLKAENLKEKKGSFVCDDVKVIPSVMENGETRYKLEIEVSIDSVDYVFVPNWTNTKFIKSKTLNPKSLLGKRIFYEIGKATNPETGKYVDSIVLTDIQ